MRVGEEVRVHHNEIVVGDMIKLKAGMNIPVDGILVRGSGVQCDESAITGESIELKKETIEVCKQKLEERDAELTYLKVKTQGNHDLPSPVMLSVTQVITGEGWFVCTVLGNSSCLGKILEKLKVEDQATPLQQKLG